MMVPCILDRTYFALYYTLLSMYWTSSYYDWSIALLAASTAFLTSAVPFSTTFSISLCAFLISSGLAALLSSIALNRFCIALLASLTPKLAFSPALPAAPSARSRDSFVGGGTGMLRCKVLWGSCCGCRFKSLEP